MEVHPDRPDHGEEDEILDDQVFMDPRDVAEIIVDDGEPPMDDDDEENHFGDDDPVQNTSVGHFLEHTSSVFTISAHPSQPLAASGGEDDLGYIWDITNGEQVVKLTGHADSVSSVEWSFDGQMIATGGMDGRVRVWRRVGDTKWTEWEFLTELQGPDEIKWLKWHPKGNVLLAGSNDGTVWLWQLPSGNTMQVFAGHEGPVECGTFTPDGKRIITGDGVGTLIFWDPRSATPVWKMSSHSGKFSLEQGITVVAVNPSSTVAVVGGGGGELRVVNLAKGEVVGVLEGHDTGQSVEAIEFVNWSGIAAGAQEVVTTGTTDGKVCIWDLQLTKLRATVKHNDAITSIHAAPLSTGSGHQITTSSMDRTLKTWDTRSGQLMREHHGHRGPVLGAAVGHYQDQVYVLSAGDDGACLIFDGKL